jgi:glycosyltransferase involved in cell wall biosynthesis
MRDCAETILIVLHDLPLGGTERIAIRLANRWAELGRKVTLLCGELGGALTPMIDEKVEVVACDPPIPRGPGSRRALGQAVARFLAARHSDLLFVPGNFHWPVMSAVKQLPVDQRPGIVAQISTPLFRHGRGPLRQIGYNRRMRHHFSGVDEAVALSPSMTHDADRILGRKITQCIRLPALEDHEPRRTLASGDLIVAAGRLVKEKGFDVALRAFALLEDTKVRLAIVGDGPDRRHLQDLAASLGVADRVAFPGYVPDIRPWLETARAFLLTSFYEGYAAVIVEALDAGRPVVATACTPAAFELLNHQGAGAVAPIGDAAALADCLRRVLRAVPPDADRLAGAVADYRIGPISQAYLRVFDTVVARRAVNADAPRTSATARLRRAPGFAASFAFAWRRSA